MYSFLCCTNRENAINPACVCVYKFLAHSMEKKQLRDIKKKASPEVSHFYIRDILFFYQFCAD